MKYEIMAHFYEHEFDREHCHLGEILWVGHSVCCHCLVCFPIAPDGGSDFPIHSDVDAIYAPPMESSSEGGARC